MWLDVHEILRWRVPGALWWVLGPLLAWRIGLRIYRIVAKHRYSRLQYGARALGLGLLTLLVGLVALEERRAFWSLMGGLAAGALLGVIATRLTYLRLGRDKAVISPDKFTGVALSLLLVGRVVWRLLQGSSNPEIGWTLAEFVRNPSTMMLWGLYSAHFLVLTIGVVRRVQRGDAG